MDEDGKKRNAAGRWLALILLLTIYVLSASPAYAWTLRHRYAVPVYKVVYAPAYWLVGCMRLQTQHGAYEQFWLRMFPPPPGCTWP